MKKQVAEDIFHVLDFGMYKGKSVGEVFDINPFWLNWAHWNTERFKLSPTMLQQLVEHIARVKKPKKNPFLIPKEGIVQLLDDEIPFA